MQYFERISSILLDELNKNKKIAIFPMGKIGTEARMILEYRFGQKGIYIDNNIKEINSECISLDHYLHLIDADDVALIVCFEKLDLNLHFYNRLKCDGLRGELRSVLEYTHEVHNEKELFFKEIKKRIRVKKALNHDLARVGRDGDGGYVMIDDFSMIRSAYCFGVGNDVSFDEFLARKGIVVNCYDYTVFGVKSGNKNIVFKKEGISGTDIEDESLYSIETLLNTKGDIDKNELILKLDVEGAEWDFLETVSENTMTKFQQITMELHNLTDLGQMNRILFCLDKLNSTHQVVWLHANNISGVECAGSIEVPPLMEVTYASRQKYQFDDISYSAPGKLDYPNVKTSFDVDLKGWGSLDELLFEGKMR